MIFHLGPREIIYLNSYDVIREAFVKSGNSFSGRPQDWFWLAELCHGRGKLYSCFYRPQRSCGQGHVFTGVCLSTGGWGGCLPQCMLGYHSPRDQADPPGPDRHPPGPGRNPPDQADPLDQEDPRTRQTPLGPGRHPPQTRQTPPWTRQTPARKQTAAYGLRAAGTHPTGMHSCWKMKSLLNFCEIKAVYDFVIFVN